MTIKNPAPKLSKILRPLAIVLALALASPLAATATATPTATPTASFTPSPTVTLTAVCGSTFGCSTCTAGSFGGSFSSQINSSQFYLGQDGTVNAVFVYLTGTTGGRIRVGVYADASNVPTSLLAQSEEKTTVEGWNEFVIYPTHLTQGNYWLTALSEPNRVFFNMSPGGRSVFLNYSYGPMPTVMPVVTVGTNSSGAIYASYCPGPPIFYTPTPTPTVSPTPLQYQAAPQGKLAMGPVPVRQGELVCLYFDQAPVSSTWEVFNVRGQRVSSLSFNLGESACWNTKAIAPGLYIARAKVQYANGTSGQVTQKVVVVK